MKHWSAQQLVALSLAVFIAAGLGMSVAAASGMTTKMAMMSEMAMSAHGDCQDCPDKPGNDGITAMACGNVCPAPIFAAVAAAIPIPIGSATTAFAASGPLLHGRTLSPDPYPPRTSNIG